MDPSSHRQLVEEDRFDSYIDKSGIGSPLERAGFADSGRLVAQIVFYLIALMVLKLALSAFGENDISAALDGLIAWIPKLLVGIAIVIVTGLVANAVGDMPRPSLANNDQGSMLTMIATSALRENRSGAGRAIRTHRHFFGGGQAHQTADRAARPHLRMRCGIGNCRSRSPRLGRPVVDE